MPPSSHDSKQNLNNKIHEWIIDLNSIPMYNTHILTHIKDHMIINSAPTNEAILSNVGEIGEFRIRNSAKAFSILSSGLYANKIRAIIRELSCNAVDSHVAAGKSETPFDVHLPNQLEPWFSIRDYGTGLTNDQVTSIYTTYFESTKTDSNAFIGALGLGSKSPFSYTDNFTVTDTRESIAHSSMSRVCQVLRVCLKNPLMNQLA